jgi:hypothetical protein
LPHERRPISHWSHSMSDGHAEGSDRFGEVIAAFLAAPKSSASGMSWRIHRSSHKDYARAQIAISHSGMPRVRSRVVLLSHIYQFPRKYSFTLLFGTVRVASLDVNPGRNHRNALQRKSVGSTHWSFYPCDVVTPDPRSLNHISWFNEFFERCNIDFKARYATPIHDREQLELSL